MKLVKFSSLKQFKRSKFGVAAKVLHYKLNIAKRSYGYQKSKHFSNALKDSGVYVYQLLT